MTKILTLDLGRRTGWCIGTDKGYVDSGVHELYSERDAREFSDGARFDAFYRFLDSLGRVDFVAYEFVGNATKGRQTALYNGYRSTLLLWAMRAGFPVIAYSPGQIKKHVTGKGNATKQEVIDAVTALGVLPYDDNEADAVATYFLWRDAKC